MEDLPTSQQGWFGEADVSPQFPPFVSVPAGSCSVAGGGAQMQRWPRILASSPHQRGRPPSPPSSSLRPQARGYFYLPQNANEAPIPRLSQREKFQIPDRRFSSNCHEKLNNIVLKMSVYPALYSTPAFFDLVSSSRDPSHTPHHQS